MEENNDYLKTQIITYMGNKRKLIPHILKCVKLVKSSLNKDKLIFGDLFCGTGVVSRAMKKHSSFMLCNDLEEFSRVTNSCYIKSTPKIFTDEYELHFNNIQNKLAKKDYYTTGIINSNYTPLNDLDVQRGERAFYTNENALIIDTVVNYIFTEVPEEMRDIFLAPIIQRASVNVNTAGMFNTFLKNKKGIGQYGGGTNDALERIRRTIEYERPVLSNFDCDVEVTKDYTESLVETYDKEFDLVYIDPPYTSNVSYGSRYFMLNLIATNELNVDISEVAGVPKNHNRSNFCQIRNAKNTLFSMLEKCNSKYQLISYSIDGLIDKEELETFLNTLGNVQTFEIDYKAYQGAMMFHDKKKVKEFVFLLERQ